MSEKNGEDFVIQSVRIKPDQKKFIIKNSINLSDFVRRCLDIRMKGGSLS